jgi:hypothetical protein
MVWSSPVVKDSVPGVEVLGSSLARARCNIYFATLTRLGMSGRQWDPPVSQGIHLSGPLNPPVGPRCQVGFRDLAVILMGTAMSGRVGPSCQVHWTCLWDLFSGRLWDLVVSLKFANLR